MKWDGKTALGIKRGVEEGSRYTMKMGFCSREDGLFSLGSFREGKKKKAQFLRLPDPGPSTLLSLKAHLPQISCLWGREL